MGWRWYWKSWDRCEALVHSSWRLTQSILLIGTLLPLTLVIWKLCTGAPDEKQTVPEVSSFSPPTGTAVVSVTDSGIILRQMLPYSVIPGGARDGTELRNAIDHDPVVATHYVTFDISRTHVVELDHNEAMYVSYRMGNRLYWTAKKLMIYKGETLLSDGQHLARTRCGNRLSDTAETPTAVKEPSRSALETPPAPRLEAIAVPPELPLSPIGPLAPPPAENTGGGEILPPPFVPIFWGGGPPGKPGVPVVPPPVTGIPEPSSLFLLGAGLSAVGLAARRKLARRGRGLPS